MPYIKQEDRKQFEDVVAKMPKTATPGEFNFVVTLLAKKYMAENGISYQHYNDVLGALDGASKEFYRRSVAPYEDQKIKENGDV